MSQKSSFTLTTDCKTAANRPNPEEAFSVWHSVLSYGCQHLKIEKFNKIQDFWAFLEHFLMVSASQT